MHFNLSDEHKMIQDMARKFAREELAPKAAELDEKSEFPSMHMPKMFELGFMSMTVDTKYGGAGMDTLSYVLALEQISAGCASTAVTMSVNNSLYCGPIQKYGTEEQKQEFLVPCATGKKLGAYCLSEPGTGSDAANQKATALLDGNDYILNGTKNFITNAPNADSFIVFAMTDKEKKTKGITAFILQKEDAGFSIGKKEVKLGIRASSTSAVVMEDCRIPKSRVLGEVGKGFNIAMNTLDYGRIGIATQALGISNAAFDYALKYAGEREAFGQSINNFQAIQWMLADMSTRIEASRLLIYRAAWMVDQKMPCSLQAAQAKLYASETSNFVTNKAVQIHGGYGYCREYPVERLLRDARITEIYEGTSEIQRLVIARNLIKANEYYFL
ncbi:MAG: acyl-CoA dehydrogenase [Deltaproteobacteria bacterium]|nr:acyl-CoA dehydrogenase [Deltaproteobacteria bacterium]